MEIRLLPAGVEEKDRTLGDKVCGDDLTILLRKIEPAEATTCTKSRVIMGVFLARKGGPG